MSLLHRGAVAARRFLVRRPWAYWLAVAVAVIGVTTTTHARTVRIDAAREAWGETRDAWVAVAPMHPGDALRVERRSLPAAMVPDGALRDVGGRVARQAIGAGEIVHDLDVVAASGPQAWTAAGRLAVPVLESPASGAALGDRVRVVSEGVVLADDAIVVGHHAEATLVAVPEADAPAIPAAADVGRVTLLLVP